MQSNGIRAFKKTSLRISLKNYRLSPSIIIKISPSPMILSRKWKNFMISNEIFVENWDNLVQLAISCNACVASIVKSYECLNIVAKVNLAKSHKNSMEVQKTLFLRAIPI